MPDRQIMQRDAGGILVRKPDPDAMEACLSEFGLLPGQDIWIFGYGSLMWNPGFPHLEARPALLRGYHRKFCVYSFRYRGTPERPGLVLGLDRGGSCRGIAFRVAAADAAGVIEYLWGREMINGVYRPKRLPVRTEPSIVEACTFVAERRHGQYCGNLDLPGMAECIRRGYGERGPNQEYLSNTVQHLRELGIHDESLERLLVEVASEGRPQGETLEA
ncbi:MAG TPA: gamma-glutamylcyclotransferase [Arenibaculum sp.]|nr:gamma-glutamylcyclotransferase [Arenibaculum sp.]